MRVACIFVLSGLFFLSQRLNSQQTSATIPRDPQAVTLLQQAVAAMGGSNAIGGVQDFTGSGSITYYWAGTEVSGPVTLRGKSGQEFRLDANVPQGTRSWAVSGGEGSLQEPTGQKSSIPFSNSWNLANLNAPCLALVAALNDPSFSIVIAGQPVIGGKQLYDLRLQKSFGATDDPSGSLSKWSQRDYLIDPATLTVVAAQDTQYSNDSPRHSFRHQIAFSDYRAVNGALFPFSITETIEGQQTWAIQLSSITLNSGLTDSTFQLYYNGSAIPANKVLALSQTFTTGQTDVQKLTQTVTTDTGLNKTVQYTYVSSSGPQISKISEWKFYSGSLPSTPDRITNYSGYCGVSPGTVTVTDGSGTVTVAKTTITYDSYGSGGLTAVNGTSNHDDTNYGTGFTARCNPTSIARLVSGTTYLTTSLTYDTTGQILTGTDPAGNQTNFSYADNFYKDTGDGTQPQSYSPTTPTNAYLTQITSASVPAGSLISKTGYYWGTGKTALTTDPNNQTATAHFFDSLDRSTSGQMPNGGWAAVTYASSDTQIDSYVGITTAFSAPWASCSSCLHTQSALDGLGRPIHNYLVSDPDGQTTVDIVYDSNGRRQSVSHPYRSTSDPTYGLETPSYDGLNRRTQLKHADNNLAKTYYGSAVGTNGGASSQLCSSSTYALGYPTLFVDEIGSKRQIWTDGFGRVIEADEPNSGGTMAVNTCYAYDLNNNETGVLSAGGTQLVCNSLSLSRCFSFDALSRLTSVTTPEGGTLSYNYDSGGHLSTIVKPAPNQTGSNTVTITFGYDALNRPISRTYSDSTPAVKYGYDGSALTGCSTNPPGITITNGKGRRTAMCDGSGAAAWSYDAAGNVVSEGRIIAGQSKTISYAYNLDGSLKTLTYPSGRVVTYTTGNAARPTSIVDTTNNINYATTSTGVATYSPPGGLANILHGLVNGGFTGITESYTYNNRLQLSSVQANSSAQLALGLTFSYAQPTNNNGDITAQANSVDSGRSQTYSYDNLNRMLTAQSSATSGADCWGLSFGGSGAADDALGNLTNSTVTKCTAWPLSVGVNSHNQIITPSGYGYDAAGNTTADAVYGYTFDAENRITSASGMSGGPYCYSYDGNGLRVAKSSANGGSCTGTPTVNVLYWRSTAGDTLAETDGTGSTSNSNYHEYIFFAGRRIARSDPSSSNVYYYFGDQLGSTRAITQANGSVCFSADYYPYGEEVDYTNSCPQNYKFTGYERDAETGLDYAFARYYNPRMGRFMSVDPQGGSAGAPQSHNAYAYVRNMPAVLVDRFGACPGGVAQNVDSYESQNSRAGGPSASDLEGFDPQGPPFQSGCPGFTDQAGGADGPGGVSIDGGEVFSPNDGNSGIMGSADSTVQCPGNICSGIGTDKNGVTAFVQFIAFAGGVSGYFNPIDIAEGVWEWNGQLYTAHGWGAYLDTQRELAREALANAISLASSSPDGGNWDEIYAHLAYNTTTGSNADFDWVDTVDGSTLTVAQLQLSIPGLDSGGCEWSCRDGSMPSLHFNDGMFHLDTANPSWGFGFGLFAHGFVDVVLGHINPSVPMVHN